MRDILFNLLIPMDNRTNILETSSLLDDLRIKLHFHVNLMHYVTEFVLEVFCLGPTQPEPLDSKVRL